MRKGIQKKKLGRKRSHRKALVINQTRSLFGRGYIVTTSQKAKVLKGEVEGLLSKIGKQDELSRVRKLKKVFKNDSLIDSFNKYVKSGDSKVSIVKVGFRDGDNAELSKISLVGFSVPKSKSGSGSKVSSKSKKAKVDSSNETDSGEQHEKTLGKNIKKRFKKTFGGNKERARSRSGL